MLFKVTDEEYQGVLISFERIAKLVSDYVGPSVYRVFDFEGRGTLSLTNLLEFEAASETEFGVVLDEKEFLTIAKELDDLTSITFFPTPIVSKNQNTTRIQTDTDLIVDPMGASCVDSSFWLLGSSKKGFSQWICDSFSNYSKQ